MSSGTRRGWIPGPESRTGLVRPMMTEAEFERRQQGMSVVPADPVELNQPVEPDPEPTVRGGVSARTRATCIPSLGSICFASTSSGSSPSTGTRLRRGWMGSRRARSSLRSGIGNAPTAVSYPSQAHPGPT